MKRALYTVLISAFLLACPPAFSESTPVPIPLVPKILEIGGTITAVDYATSTIKIDGKSYIVYPQTKIYIESDTGIVPANSLAGINIENAKVYYALDGKGLLTDLQIIPASQSN